MARTVQDCASQIQRVIEQIDLRYLHYPVRFAVESNDHHALINVYMEVRESNSGRWAEVAETLVVEPIEMSDDDIVMTIHRMLLAYLEHELDENFYYKGAKLRDPHAGPPIPRRM